MIAVDRCSAAELAAMSGGELSDALAEVLHALGDTARLSAQSRDAVAAAKIGVLQAQTAADRDDFKAHRIIAETQLAKIRDRAVTLRQQSTILQSLIRAAVIG